MLRSARDRFTEYCKYYPRTGRTLLRHMEEIHDPGKLMDQIIENIPADLHRKAENFWSRWISKAVSKRWQRCLRRR